MPRAAPAEQSEALGYPIWDEHQLGYGRFGDGWALLTRPAHFDGEPGAEVWKFGELKPLQRAPRQLRFGALRAIPSLLASLHTEAIKVLALVAEAEQLASEEPLPPGCMWCQLERTSNRRLEFAHPRECPACDHVFQGKGWDGIDAHWKSQHSRETGVSYEQFWRGIMGCARHWGV